MREQTEVVVDLGGGVEHRVPVAEVTVGGARGLFSGAGTGPRDGRPGRPGNLSHRRAHQPDVLAATRDAVLARLDVAASAATWMRQVHGDEVGVVPATPGPHEVRGVDGLVTSTPADAGPRALVVVVADCVPVLLASDDGRTVGVAHAGRNGVATGVVDAVVARLRETTDRPLHAVVGPAVCGRCYEVPAAMRDEVAVEHPAAASETSWGTPALDLPAAVVARLGALDVDTDRVEACTLHDDGWFSHRRDATTGRQVGVVRAAA